MDLMSKPPRFNLKPMCGADFDGFTPVMGGYFTLIVGLNTTPYDSLMAHIGLPGAVSLLLLMRGVGGGWPTTNNFKIIPHFTAF